MTIEVCLLALLPTHPDYTTKGVPLSYARTIYIIGLIGVIAVGVLSRTISTGTILIDKYLGDALYAVMILSLIHI